MSVRLHRGGWEVCWRDASGRQRARRFSSEEAARAFGVALAELSLPPAVRTPRATVLPAFGALSLSELSVDAVREFVVELAEDVEGSPSC